MKLEQGHYYHLYNRSNNGEIVFKQADNYLYFLHKYRDYLGAWLDTHTYCLMPTHFHFLVCARTDQTEQVSHGVALWLSSYTKAINKRFERHGSLFQPHTKAICVSDERYLMTLMAYIHQNPLRARLVETLDAWPYSSYPDLAGLRSGTLPCRALVDAYFDSVQRFRAYSEQSIPTVDGRYWPK